MLPRDGYSLHNNIEASRIETEESKSDCELCRGLELTLLLTYKGLLLLSNTLLSTFVFEKGDYSYLFRLERLKKLSFLELCIVDNMACVVMKSERFRRLLRYIYECRPGFQYENSTACLPDHHPS